MLPRVTEFPGLTTNRLRLREPMKRDAATLAPLWSHAAVTRFSNMADAPKPAQIERLVAWMVQLHPKGSGCAWIIEDAASATPIGAIRFNRFDKTWRYGVVGYELHPEFWGRGLMTEALRAVVTCGHEVYKLNRIEAWTLPGNPASDRVLEKTGFRYEGTLRQRAWFKGAFHDCRTFGRVTGDPVTE